MAILASPSTIQNLGYHGDGNSAPSSFTPASLYPTSHKHCRKIVWKCLRVERPLLRIPQARSVGDRCRRGARRGEYWREMQRGSARKREHDRCRGSARQRDEVSVLEESMEGDYNEGDKRIFIFGMGYTSLALANGLKKKNWTVSGTCRTDEKRAALEDCGFQAFFFNPDNDGEHLQDYAVRELYAATYVLSSIPPVGDLDEDPVLASHRYELSQAATQGKLCWIGFLSSTGIYGDWHGNWVDEDTEPQPVERRAVARFTAEKAWLELGETIGVGVHIFRLGGIYGPGRSALDTVVRQRQLSVRQQLREARRYTSRVHVADICQVIIKAMESRNALRIYNVVDDDPAPHSEVIAFAKSLLQSQCVERDTHESSDKEPTRGVESTNVCENQFLGIEVPEKRVSNNRIKEQLQIALLYPSYRSGLQAIFEGIRSPFD